MLQNYREFLATDDFLMLYEALPGLLDEFNAGTLTQQAKIMDYNGGYSLTPAPPTSVLPGCDLIFLRMEQSDRWPEFFEMLDPEFRSIVGASRVDQNKANVEQINAIASYELTSEEKMHIYNTGNKFIQDWFDSYGYMDDVILIKPNAIKSWTCKSTNKINKVGPHARSRERASIRTHSSESGVDYLLKHRKEHPGGQCLIVTAIRSPAAWFGSMYLEGAKQHWDTSEVMLQNYREFLATDDFDILYEALPGLLDEFNAGTLTQQAKIMDYNGGYSLTP